MKPSQVCKVVIGALGACALVGGSGCGGDKAETPTDPPPSEAPQAEVPSDGWSVWQRIPSPGSAAAVACGDVDGDGHGDVAIAAFGAGVQVLRGGTSGLTPVWTSPEPSETQGVAWGDLDGDGKPELALAEREGKPNRVAKWTGSTMEIVWTAASGDESKSVTWADVDGDGDLDLVVANVGANVVHVNEAGVLRGTLPLPGAEETDTLAAFDADGDGDLDLYEGNSGAKGSPDRLLIGDAKGGFAAGWTGTDVRATNEARVIDVNGDGLPELALAYAGSGEQVLRFEGGVPEVLWESEEPSWNATSVSWGDVDGDGDGDLAVSSMGGARIYLADAGALTLGWSSKGLGTLEGGALCDVDGDGALEWIVSNQIGDHLVLGRGAARSWGAPGAGEPADVAGDAADGGDQGEADEGGSAQDAGESGDEASEGADAGEGAAPSEPDPKPVLGTHACPKGMIPIPGGTHMLGEDDTNEILPGEWSKHTIRLTSWTVAPYCIAELPFPGVAGSPWPKDGLNPPQVAALDKAVREAGRRVCRADELLLAAAGPANWRYPYHAGERGSLDDPAYPCPVSDETPGKLGAKAACLSPYGVRDLQVRSSWAATPKGLRATLKEAKIDLAGLEADYAVYGSTARIDTWYPPSNFSMHSHPPDAASYLDDHVRLCADVGAASKGEETAWTGIVQAFGRSGLFETWLGVPADPNPAARDSSDEGSAPGADSE